MGVQLSSSKSSSRRRAFVPQAEINVTPMVDVMLVLLVIFMVTAPLMNHGVPVDLPSSASPPLQDKQEPCILTLTREGGIFVGQTSIPPHDLPDHLRRLTGGNPETRIYLRADTGLSYGQVMDTMGRIQQAGYGKVALLSEPRSSK
jgi:biopolymer transport protein TolR